MWSGCRLGRTAGRYLRRHGTAAHRLVRTAASRSSRTLDSPRSRTDLVSTTGACATSTDSPSWMHWPLRPPPEPIWFTSTSGPTTPCSADTVLAAACLSIGQERRRRAVDRSGRAAPSTTPRRRTTTRRRLRRTPDRTARRSRRGRRVGRLARLLFHRHLLLPATPGLPTLRAFQAAQGAITRRWLAQRVTWL